ncbi:MAG: uncharacterized protein KVP18_001212 [Porospora cf. gigantea A]|uniref:uncharacterized protein n=1 Tax=Porospora cf. gigantea A TaxID=2853593 RepID=UPI00355A22D7|nr:MAG: hypothetical protein KVP18_001212 [Porospora cf. gigantea A]
MLLRHPKPKSRLSAVALLGLIRNPEKLDEAILQSVQQRQVVDFKPVQDFDNFISQLQEHAIRTIVIDFDSTLLDKSVGGGASEDSIAELATHLSADAISLACWAHKNDLPVYVATHNDERFAQVDKNGVRKLAGERLVRAVHAKTPDNDSWPIKGVFAFYPDVEPCAKNEHLKLVCKDARVPNHEVVLIDDNQLNCEAALAAGHHAVLVVGPGFRFSTAQWLQSGI